MSNAKKKAAEAVAAVDAIDLNDYVSQDAPVPFTVAGVKNQLFGKVLSIDEAAAVIRTASDPKSNFITELCAAVVVNADGAATGDNAWWGRWKSKNSQVLLDIANKCKEINGMLSAVRVGDAGKPSGATPEPA